MVYFMSKANWSHFNERTITGTHKTIYHDLYTCSLISKHLKYHEFGDSSKTTDVCNSLIKNQTNS